MPKEAVMEEVKEEIQDTTEMTDLSGDALAEALAKAQADESSEDAATPLGGKDNGEAQPEVEVTGTEESNGTQFEEGTEETQGTTTEGEGETELEKLKRTLEEKEKFNQRIATEMGELRKQLLEAERAKLPKIDPTEWQNAYYENPQAALTQAQEAERQRQAFQMREVEVTRQANQEAVAQFAPDFEDLKADIAEIAKSDGVRPEHLSAFQNDPYGTSDVQTLLSYAARARDAKKLRDMEAKVAEYEAKTKNITQKIETAAKKPRTVTNTAGTSTTVKAPISEEQILEMSSAERNKLLEQLIADEKGD